MWVTIWYLNMNYMKGMLCFGRKTSRDRDEYRNFEMNAMYWEVTRRRKEQRWMYKIRKVH